MVPVTPFSCVLFGLAGIGLGIYAIVIGSESVALVVLGLVFILVGLGAVAGGIAMRSAGHGWFR